MPSELDKMLHVQQAALQMREVRQGLLTSNIANADTPHYKAVDINFKKALDQALGTSGKQGTLGTQGATGALPLAKSSPKHIGAEGRHSGLPPHVSIQYRATAGRIDGNNVSLDGERVEAADNVLRHGASVSIISSYLRSMKTVIQGN